MVSSKKVKECLDLLEDLTSYFTINLQWVPGHSDILANSEADELARAGTTLHIASEKEGIFMPLATCKHLISEHVDLGIYPGKRGRNGKEPHKPTIKIQKE